MYGVCVHSVFIVGGVKDRIETAVVSSRDSSPSPESLKNLMTDTRKSRCQQFASDSVHQIL